LFGLKEPENFLDREEKRAQRTLSTLFSIQNPSGALSGGCPMIMVDKYKGSRMCDSNAPVEEHMYKVITVDQVRKFMISKGANI
jgi:hypothetical protein